MFKLKIKNLKLRAIIGINPEERERKQDLIINYEVWFEADKSKNSDDIQNTLNYKTINKEIIRLVNKSNYFLLEKLVSETLGLVAKHREVLYARVEIDKVGALRYAKSVSISEEYHKLGKPLGKEHEYILLLGSNINPNTNMGRAIDLLKNRFSLTKISSITKTKAVGCRQGSPDFLNSVVLARSPLSLFQMKKKLNKIEKELGRLRDPGDKNSPRTIDIDIIGINGLIVDPDFYTKSFIKKLALELIPNLVY